MRDTALRTISEHRLIEAGDRIVTGFSGGADSTALLSLLCELRESLGLRLLAVHLNHGLRGDEADADESFCRDFCLEHDILFSSFREDVARSAAINSMSAEEYGRKRRYELFEQAAAEFGAEKIAVAHNRWDLAETVLHRIARGTGIKGLAGIARRRGKIIRPLLDCGRDMITDYLNKIGQPWREDSSNAGNGYTRNKIRNVLLPWLRDELNPRVSDALINLAEEAAQTEIFLNELAAAEFAGKAVLSADSAALPLGLIGSLAAPVANRLIRLALAHLCPGIKDIERGHIEDIKRLCGLGTGKSIDLPYGVHARISYGELLIERVNPDAAFPGFELLPDTVYAVPGRDLSVRWQYGTSETVPNAAVKRFAAAAPLELRTRKPGDKFTKSLSDYFIDIKLDRRERDSVPLLASGSQVIVIFLQSEPVYNYKLEAKDGMEIIIGGKA